MLVGCRESEQPGGHSNLTFLPMTAAQDNCWFFFSFFKSHQSCAELVSTCLLPMRSNHLYHHVNATAHSCTEVCLSPLSGFHTQEPQEPKAGLHLHPRVSWRDRSDILGFCRVPEEAPAASFLRRNGSLAAEM